MDTNRIIELLKEAHQLSVRGGVYNLFSRGKIHEMVMADILGHDIVQGIDGPDASSGGELFEYKSKVLPCGRFDVSLKPNTWHDDIEYFFFGIFKSWLDPVEIRRISRKALLSHSSDGVHCVMKLSEVKKKGITFFDITRKAWSTKRCPGAAKWFL